MNSKFLPMSFLLLAVFNQSALAAQNTISLKNQRGSVLELKILPDNKIAGYFTTAVASKTCPQAIDTKRPITGYLLGNALTFSVSYPICDSVLSISGNFDNDKETLDTLSILNKQASDITHEGPGARFIGHDFYKRLS
ncbi:Avidin family [Legionella beliardensis]|uniref:Avidin family n=1 Tax=Legionella beliardensis TaxID=91822 RepID=A0A378I3W9_9GAMM|nr:avidin/streptavidin family protein [Legionella beliardensis]STX29450.1 Avidin family [Legionella beliardensis]